MYQLQLSNAVSSLACGAMEVQVETSTQEEVFEANEVQKQEYFNEIIDGNEAVTPDDDDS